MKLQILFTFIIIITTTSALDVLCYYEHQENSTFTPDRIDTETCNIIYYSFSFDGPNADGSLPLDDADASITQLAALKAKNARLRVLISLGGWGASARRFSDVAAAAGKRAAFAESAHAHLERYGVDGLDIDWEYPGGPGGAADDKDNFVQLLRTVKERFAGKYMLTIATYAVPDPNYYDVSALNDVVDHMNVMTYSLHHPSGGKTGQNAPLYASQATDTVWEKANANVASVITNWLGAGALPGKLAMGLAFYGKGYQLADGGQHGVGVPTVGYSAEDVDSYRSVCQLVGGGWTEVWDDEQMVPYKYSDVDWIGFDNEKSIQLKMEYAKNAKLGAVMVWSVDRDDYDGVCGTKNVLLNTVRDNL